MIPGISDVNRLPRLGKIRLGEKKKSRSGKDYPSALDHFNLKDAPGVSEIYGDKPRELDIMFPLEDRDVFFPQALKAYRTSGLFCRCDDGQTASRVRLEKEKQGHDPQGEGYIKAQGLAVDPGEMYELPCPYQECSFFQKKMCKPIGRLLFMLPKVPRFGCYEIDTTSWHSMVNINNYVNAIRNAAGKVAMIPLKLLLRPQQVQADGRSKNVHVLELVYEGTTQDLLAIRPKALPVPAKAMPKEEHKNVPDDLVPNAGESLDEELGGEEVQGEIVKAADARAAFGNGNGKPKTAPAPAAKPKPDAKRRPWG